MIYESIKQHVLEQSMKSSFDPHAEFEKEVWNEHFKLIRANKPLKVLDVRYFAHISTNPESLTFEEYKAKLQSLGLIDRDENSPGKCWLRSLFPDREDEV